LSAPIPSPGSEASSGRGAAGASGATEPNFPNNPRLEAQSRKLDRQIKRGICVGC
jgi:hypothetical protein